MSDVLGDFAGRLPACGNLLDLGCGAGEPFACEFPRRGWDVTGVDFSARMLELATRYAPRMRQVRADMRDANFAKRSFDAVAAIYSLFHVPASDHPALFARIRGWLRPEGILLFTYATRAYTGQDRFDGHITFMGQELYYSHVTRPELDAQLVAAGFSVIEARERSIGGETFLWVTSGVSG